MREPRYSEALTKAWHLVWHNKVLWVFGLLSIVLGQFGLNNFIGQLLALGSTTDPSEGPWWNWPASWPVIQIGTPADAWLFSWVFVILLAVVVLVVVAAVLSQGALIVAAADYFKNETRPNLRKAWRKGVRHGWRLFALNLVQKIFLAGILVTVIAVTQAINADSLVGFAAVVMALGLATLLALAVSTVTVYAAGYMVEYEQPWFASLWQGVQLLDQHLLVSFELSVLLLLCNAFLIGAVVLGSFVVVVPSFFLWVTAGLTGHLALLSVGFVIAFFLFLLLVVFCGALFNAFTTSAWMFLFMRMHHQGLKSRLWYWIERVVRRN